MRTLAPGIIAALIATGMVSAAQVSKPVERTRISSEQIGKVSARVATAMAILDRVSDEAKQRGLSDGWRQATLETLLLLRPAKLRQIERRVISLDALDQALSETRDAPGSGPPGDLDDPGALGSPDFDLVYTPITPCRFIDTRNAVGKINAFRNYTLWDSGAAHGGSAACYMPSLFGAAAESFGALAMNVTVVDTSTAGAPGFLAVNPVALSQTTSLLNWYQAGVYVQVANLGIITIDQESSHPFEFAIQTSGPVHVVVDIFGAFLAPRRTAIETLSVSNSNVPIGAGQTVSGLSPACPSGFSVIGGSCLAAPLDLLFLQSTTHVGSAWACVYRSASSTTETFTVQAICGRVPGR
jgi:hypothetical protein